MLPDFDPTVTEFSIENAYVLMRACQATYSEDNDSYFARLAELGIDGNDQEWIPLGHDACFVGWTDAWTVVAFRGTNNPGGWISNVYGSRPVSRPRLYYGKVHRGFDDGLEMLWEKLLETLISPQAAGKPLFLTGHSRGGALATLAAQRLHYEGI